MKRVLILFSGGYDSTLLVELAKSMELVPVCVLFDYGQKHKEELIVAKKFCKDNEIEHIPLKIPINVSSRLTHGAQEYEGVSEWHVPGRNLIFLSHVVSMAEGMRIDRIWFGANYEDRINLFPDCYQEWVWRLNQLLEINGSRPITVEAPLVGMTKQFIEAFGMAVFGLEKEKTFSGYGDIK